MPSKQKAKGNNFERTIAKHLSTVFGHNFERVPTSGAMTGGLNAHVLERLSDSQKLLLEGDLIPPDEMPNLKIECKSPPSFAPRSTTPLSVMAPQEVESPILYVKYRIYCSN